MILPQEFASWISELERVLMSSVLENKMLSLPLYLYVHSN